MAAGAIPPPLFFEQRRFRKHFGLRPWHPKEHLGNSSTPWKHNQRRSRSLNGRRAQADHPSDVSRRIVENMANTTSAKKATRKIARRTIINKSRRTQMRGAVRTVEEAIKNGDRDAAIKAMVRAEPELMQAAQRNIIHRNNASRKVSRLTHAIAKLAK
jgi:small subunit ribosomal protein S20